MKGKLFKRLASMLLTVCMIATLLPTNVFAATTETLGNYVDVTTENDPDGSDSSLNVKVFVDGASSESASKQFSYRQGWLGGGNREPGATTVVAKAGYTIGRMTLDGAAFTSGSDITLDWGETKTLNVYVTTNSSGGGSGSGSGTPESGPGSSRDEPVEYDPEDTTNFPGFTEQGEVAVDKHAHWVTDPADPTSNVNKYAQVTLTLKGTAVDQGADVILVLDRSGSMEWCAVCGNKEGKNHQRYYGHAFVKRWAETKTATASLVNSLFANKNVPQADGTTKAVASKNRVALVKFESSVQDSYIYQSGAFQGVTVGADGAADTTATQATKDAINTWVGNTANGGTNYKAALTAVENIVNAHKAEGTGKPLYVIFMSDGKPDPSSNAPTSTQKTWIQNESEITGFYTVGFGVEAGSDADTQLGGITKAPGTKNLVTGAGALTSVFNVIANQVKSAGTDAIVHDIMGNTMNSGNTNFTLVQGNDALPILIDGQPAAADQITVNADGSIDWNVGNIPADGITLTYYVEIHDGEAGNEYYTNDSAEVTYKNYRDYWCEKPFPMPQLTYPGNSIQIIYYAVNASGQPVDRSGIPIDTDDIASRGVTWGHRYVKNETGGNILTPGQDYSVDIDKSSTNGGVTYAKSMAAGTLWVRDEAGNIRNVTSSDWTETDSKYLFTDSVKDLNNAKIVYAGYVPDYKVIVFDKYGETTTKRSETSVAAGAAFGPVAKLETETHEYVSVEVKVGSTVYANLDDAIKALITISEDVVSGTMPNNNVTITYTYAPKDSGYTVHYYKDSVAAGNEFGTPKTVTTWNPGTGVTNIKVGDSVAVDTAAVQYDGTLPAGYTGPGAVDPTIVAITSVDPANNIVNVVYQKISNLSYTIQYYYENVDGTRGDKIGSDVLVQNVVWGTVVGLTGEQLDARQPGENYYGGEQQGADVTITGNGNVIEVWYAPKDTTYKVEFYYDNVKDHESAWLTGKVGQLVDDYTDPQAIRTGYRFGSDNAPITLVLDNAQNIIRVYYVKDDFAYTVNYHYPDVQGLTNPSSTVSENGVFQSRIPYSETPVDASIYEFDRTELNSTERDSEGKPIVSADAAKNVVDVYFKVRAYGYTVHYFYGGVEDTSKIVDNTTALYGDRITSYTAQPKTGYSFDKAEVPNQDPTAFDGTTNPLVITSDKSKNVINVYYSPDNAGYKVIYHYETGEEGGSKTYSQLHDTGKIDADFDSSVPITDDILNAQLNNPALGGGYVLNRTESDSGSLAIDSTDFNENVINVYYDKNTFSYSVEYYYQNVKDDDATETGLSAKYGETISTYTDKPKTGYKFDKVEPTTIGTNPAENVVKVYYVKDTFTYVYKYFYDEVEETDKQTAPAPAEFESEITTLLEKPRDGYRLEEVLLPNGTEFDADTNPLVITAVNENNYIELHYVKDDFGYTVEYYYDGDLDSTKTETGTATYQDVIDAYTDKVIDGYKLEKTENFPLTISHDASQNVIKVYYVKDTFGYTVEYYYDGVIKPEKTESKTATFGDTISSYTGKNIDGYKFEKAQAEGKAATTAAEGTLTEGLVITSTPANNVIRVYYVKDSFDYTVEYYYDGVIDPSKTDSFEATYQDVIRTYAGKNIDGYKLDKTENLPLTVSHIEADNVIRVYYVKDSFDYTVEYYYDGVIDDKLTTDPVKAEFGSQITTYEPQPKDGYKFDRDTAPLTITSDSAKNVLKVYYVKDTFGYTVEYYYDGKIDESKTGSFTATFEDQISTYAGKNITGYKFEKAQAQGTSTASTVEGTLTQPLTVTHVAADNVIRVYYVKDSFDYTVEYYYDGVIDDTLTTDPVKAEFGSQITTYEPQLKDGYKFSDDTAPLTITEDASQNVIRVYYVKDTFRYTVEYYYDGAIDESKTDGFTATFEEQISTYLGKPKDGYKFEKAQAEGKTATTAPGALTDPLVITSKADKNVIRVYYVKDSFNYTVEYYYDGKIDSSKTEGPTKALFGSEIDSYTDKVIDGYKLSTVLLADGSTFNADTNPLVIGSNAANNVIRVYYVRDVFGYTVEYYYDGQIDASKTVTEEATFGDTISAYTGKNITGYKFEKAQAEGTSAASTVEGTLTQPLTVTHVAADNVIRVYYVKDSFNYTVEYYYDGTKDDSKTETESATYQDVISTYTDKMIDGYKLQKTEHLPLTVTENPANNVIRVYYVKDSFDYTVEYYYDGQLDASKTEGPTKAEFASQITTYTDKVIDGYKLDKTENLPLTITSNPDNNVIRVYYVKDSFDYTVEYYYDGVKDDSKTEGPTKAEFASQITSYTDKKIDGYKLDPANPANVPLTITSDPANNVIRVYYIKDSFDYTVEYYYDGKIDTSKTDSFSATFGDVISTYTDKKIDGYKLDTTQNLPLTITSNPDNNVIRIYYVKDTFAYSVEYYYDGVLDPTRTDRFSATFGDVIEDYTSKGKDGYKLDDEQNLPLTITSNPDNNVIRIYYVKDSFGYTVEYYYDGKIDTSKTDSFSATFGDVIRTYADKNIDGYKLDTTQNLPLTITSNPDSNVIRIYYVKDTFGYTVEYYYNGVKDDTKTDSFTATFGDVISDYADKVIDGYKFDRDTAPLTITSNSANNVLKVYYVKDVFGYTVEYYYDGKLDETKTVGPVEATFGDTIDVYAGKRIDGYKFEKAQAEGKAATTAAEGTLEAPLVITSKADKNVIRVYYVKDSFDYTVEYYYDGVKDDSKTEGPTKAEFASQITSYTDKNIDGYKLEKTENLPLTITSNSANNVIRVYYVKDSFDYTVEYYYDGKIDTSKTEGPTKAEFASQITTYTDKKIDGYKLDKTENLPLTITSNSANNVIRVYYVKDSFDYTVEYYYDGQLDASKTEGPTKAEFASQITTYTDKVIDGYKFDRDTAPLTITSNSANNVLKVYYVKDSFDYTVEYYYDGVKDASKTEGPTKAEFASQITSYTDKVIDGYKFDRDTAPLTITSDPAANVLKVYYVKDSFDYTVEYYYDGVKDDSLTTEPVKAEFGSQIATYTPQPRDGYKFSRDTAPLTITSNSANNILKVYYVRDDFAYTVKYYIDDLSAENYVGEYSGTATFNELIPYELTPSADKDYAAPEGYGSTGVRQSESAERVSSNPANNIVYIVYGKNSYGYTVKYYKDSVSDANYVGEFGGTAPFKSNIPYELTPTADKAYKAPTGYKATGFIPATPASQLTVTATSANNIVYVVYEKDSFNYVINHIYEGDSSLDYTEGPTKAEFASQVGYTPNEKTGFRFDRVTGVDAYGKLTISANERENVINVYYTPKAIGYTVHYFYDGVEDESLKVENTSAKYLDVITSYTRQPKNGYDFSYAQAKGKAASSTDNGKLAEGLAITADIAENYINVYYISGQVGYTINYYKDKITTPDDSVYFINADTDTALYKTTVTADLTKWAPEGYIVPGTPDAQHPDGTLYIDDVSSKNVMNVLYVKDSFPYIVNYYYDSIDSEHYLGSSDVGAAKEFASRLTEQQIAQDLGANWIDAEKPAGFQSGVNRSGEIVIRVDDKLSPSVNIVNVLYVRDSIAYSVEHYIGEGSDTSAYQLYDTDVFDKDGDKIVLGDTVDSYTKKDIAGYAFFKDENCPLIISAVAADNVIRVYYSRIPGEITIEKDVRANEPVAEGTEFYFKVTGPDGYEQIVTVTADAEGKFDAVTLSNLAWGAYTIVEVKDADGTELTDDFAYVPSFEDGTTVVVGAEKQSFVKKVTNIAKAGNLTITKMVDAVGALEGPFVFEIYLTEMKPAENPYSVGSDTGIYGVSSDSRNPYSVGSDTYHIGGDTEQLPVEVEVPVELTSDMVNGIALKEIREDGKVIGYSFSLRSGESLVISGLMEGVTYKVREVNDSGASFVTVSGNTEGIMSDEGAAVTFTNHFKSIALTKRYANRTYDGDVTIELWRKGTDGDDVLVGTYELAADETEYIYGLEDGEYYAVEVDAPSRYSVSYSDNVVIDEDNVTGELIVTNTYRRPSIDPDPDPDPKPDPDPDPKPDPEPEPEPEEPIEIPDEETPLAPPPKEEEIEIDDEDVPLANLPKTGGLAGIPMGLFGLMAIGGGIFLKKKNQDEE